VHVAISVDALLLPEVSSLCTVRSESRCALRLRYVDLVVSVLKSLSLYSVDKQRLKSKKVCNCLIQFLPTVILKLAPRLPHGHTHFTPALYFSPVRWDSAKEIMNSVLIVT
jgi:hypothetical protein